MVLTATGINFNFYVFSGVVFSHAFLPYSYVYSGVVFLVFSHLEHHPFFLVCPHHLYHLLSLFMLSNYEDNDFGYDDDFGYDNNVGQPNCGPCSQFLPKTDVQLFDNDDDGTLATTKHLPPSQLRSRPPIDFSGRGSTVGSNTNYGSNTDYGSDAHYLATLFSRPHSQISSSSHSVFKPRALFLCKTPSLDMSPRLPVAIIASLTISELSHNPHYCELCQKYNHVLDVLATYVGRDLKPHPPNCDPIASGVYKGAFLLYFRLTMYSYSTATAPYRTDSPTPLLPPSDSTSQLPAMKAN